MLTRLLFPRAALWILLTLVGSMSFPDPATSESYIAGQFGVTLASELTDGNLTSHGLSGLQVSDQDLKSSLMGGIKLGHYFTKARWLGDRNRALLYDATHQTGYAHFFRSRRVSVRRVSWLAPSHAHVGAGQHCDSISLLPASTLCRDRPRPVLRPDQGFAIRIVSVRHHDRAQYASRAQVFRHQEMGHLHRMEIQSRTDGLYVTG